MSQPVFDPHSDDLLGHNEHEGNAEASELDAAELEAAQALLAWQAHLMILDRRGRAGANWFYWVAALSMVNSVITLTGGDRHFVLGLAVTQIVDAVGMAVANGKAPGEVTIITGITFVITLMVAGFVSLFGWLANRRYIIPFILGMLLYVGDGALYALLIQDWMSVGFHAFALYGMWNGLLAFRELKTLEVSHAVEPAPA